MSEGKKTAFLLSIGEELLEGRIVDTNAPFLAEEFLGLGMAVVGMHTCGDAPGSFAEQLSRWDGEVDVLVATGGLGPTVDDRVRAECAEFLKTTLVDIPGAVEPLQDYFSKNDEADAPEYFLAQGRMPSGASAFRNRAGTAWAFYVRLPKGSLLCCLPGPPHEVQAVWRDGGAKTMLADSFGMPEAHAFGTFQTVGVPEAILELQVRDLLEHGKNPRMGITARGKVVTLSAMAHPEGDASAKTVLEATAVELRNRLGPVLFGRDGDTLAARVVRVLASQGQSVATAESCTGGQLSQALTDIPGASKVFRYGWITYADEAKSSELGVDAALIQKYGAVSKEVACAMADGAQQRSHSDWALALTGVAGPDGGTSAKPVGLVWLGIAGPHGVTAIRRQQGTRAGRPGVQQGAVMDALDLLRRELLGIPSLDSTPSPD